MLEEAIPNFSPNLSETPKALSSKNACILGIIFFISAKLIFIKRIVAVYGYFFLLLQYYFEST